jgi:large subunit ribosomal protein L4
MQIKVYNQEGKLGEGADFSDSLFGEKKFDQDLIHQVMVALLANKRRPTAHTKGRSERRGGGKKPWRQKGTGRARHGSIRSPIWRGGGVTFGPSNRTNFSKKVNKKERQLALAQVLSKKLRDKRLKIFEGFDFKKTKDVAKLFKRLKLDSVLIVNKKGSLAARNLEKVKVTKNLSFLDTLNFKHLILIEKEWKDR